MNNGLRRTSRSPTNAELRELMRLREAQVEYRGTNTIQSEAWWSRREYVDYIRDLHESGCTLDRLGEAIGLSPASIANKIILANELDARR